MPFSGRNRFFFSTKLEMTINLYLMQQFQIYVRMFPKFRLKALRFFSFSKGTYYGKSALC